MMNKNSYVFIKSTYTVPKSILRRWGSGKTFCLTESSLNELKRSLPPTKKVNKKAQKHSVSPQILQPSSGLLANQLGSLHQGYGTAMPTGAGPTVPLRPHAHHSSPLLSQSTTPLIVVSSQSYIRTQYSYTTDSRSTTPTSSWWVWWVDSITRMGKDIAACLPSATTLIAWMQVLLVLGCWGAVLYGFYLGVLAIIAAVLAFGHWCAQLPHEVSQKVQDWFASIIERWR